VSGTRALSQTRAANFWRKIYSWGRGRLDVEIVCGGLHAHDWIYTGRARNYMELLELCEKEFSTLPVQSASKVRYTVASMAGAVATNANCPRCRKGSLYVETDIYGESRRCLICGYRD
jgi:hypothetical protein